MRILFLLVASCIYVTTQGQIATSTQGISAKPIVIDMSAPVADFFPEIKNVQQHVLPSAAYGTKKQELQQKRMLFEQNKQPIPLLQKRKIRNAVPSPVQAKGFTANTSSSVPLDNDIAVSNGGAVVSVVNSNMRLYDDTGKALLVKSLTTMVSSLGTFTWISDPRVIYDAEADRFVLVCFTGDLSTDSKIFVGFTQTNDPAGLWNFYALNGNSFNDSTWSDYPIIAINHSDLYMTFNQVKDNVSWTVGFKQSVIWQIDKQLGYSGAPLQYTLWSNLQDNGKPFRNICPAKQQSFPLSNEQYFLSVRNVDTTNDSVFLFKINNSYTSGAAAISTQALVSNTSYGFPPNAVQKFVGSQQYLMTNDARILAAIYENDRIYFGSNSLNPTYMNAAVYVGTIKNVATSPSVTATLLSNDSTEYAYPAITYMGNANTDHKILYSFSHCRKNGFAGNSTIYQDANDNFSDIVALKEGSNVVNVLADSNERWGDYSQIQKKYNTNNRAYMANSFAMSGNMRTHIAIIDNMDIPTATNTIEKKKEETILYPNPSNTTIHVTFSIPEKQKLHFEILDIQGKHLYTLIQDYAKPGENMFQCSTNPLANGTYILRISNATSNTDIAKKIFTVQR